MSSSDAPALQDDNSTSIQLRGEVSALVIGGPQRVYRQQSLPANTRGNALQAHSSVAFYDRKMPMEPIKLESWDPLAPESDEPDLVIAAQKREIRNILKSYTGYYDLFSELLQNALDAVEKRSNEGDHNYTPAIWIRINLPEESVSVTDN